MKVNLAKLGLVALVVLAIATGSLMSVLSLGANRAAFAASVEPVVVEGNPTCADLGYPFGIKVDPPSSGTYTIWNGYTLTVNVYGAGVYFDWSSNLGIDAVIVKGGPKANVYIYDPPSESFGDTQLHAPTNPSGGYADLSHMEFCYDWEVSVSKTASTTFTRRWNWTIDKSVTPAKWDLFRGDSGTSRYTIAVTKTGYTDSDWAVSGDITIQNLTPYTANITGVTDVVDGISPTVNCGVSFPYSLASGGTLVCTYATALPSGATCTNTATVTTGGTVKGGSATAPVVFTTPTTVVNDSIHVDDSNGGSWEFGNSGSVSYTRTFTCDADKGTHENTATIRETKQSDSASVDVACYALNVRKDAKTSFTRTYNWTIDKIADQSSLTLATGEQLLVNYSVKVDATYADSNWAVNGTIRVRNPAPIPATINGISDIVSPDIAATVDCGVTFPHVLDAGAYMDCTYSAALPNARARINTATATLQNYDYDYQMNATADGTTGFSRGVPFDFSAAAITEVDKCVDVTDSYARSLGTVCYPDVPKTFTYSRWIGPYSVCGDYMVSNTASFVTKDTSTSGSDTWNLSVRVPCQGCTLTPGYWKTHSKYGPAPYDDTWALLGEDTTFFLSGKSYYQVLWTNPSGGNAYYILAHAYIAAKLNQLNGADFTAAQAAFNSATALFNLYTPEYIATLKGKAGTDLRSQFISLAGILDAYNNGYIGPGHCSE